MASVLEEVRVPDSDWRVGDYQILEEIGRGGMSVIYRARQVHSRRIVALKRVLGLHGDSNETLSRFQREAQAAASLDHPNILPIYEVGRCQNGLPFFSMKFAAGGSLLQALPALRNCPRDAVELMVKVARAVDHAHRRGIIHRDLKPGNILLDAAGEPFVADFGLAKWLDRSLDLTHTLTIFGTPGYIAPEQAYPAREELTPAVDVYSLGAILFELLSGRPPFLGEHALTVIQQAADKPAPKLRSIIAGHDRDLETICGRCLERDASARYQSAGDLADDLARWLEDRPIRARRISIPVRLWRWSRRNPVLAIAAVLIFILGAAAGLNQFKAQRLTNEMQQAVITNHSIVVVPFLDLDEIAANLDKTAKIADTLGTALSRIGANRVHLIKEIPVDWSGSAAPDEVREVARRESARVVLSGTLRRVGNQVRVGLHFARADGADAALNRVVTISSGASGDLVDQSFARVIYDFVSGSDQAASIAKDYSSGNERVRAFIAAGRDLMSRRTIPELDRAIVCFESAIREEPHSIPARSFLAMAYMGRDLLRSDPTLVGKALRVARDAVELAPEDPTANRSLGIVCVTNGLYTEAQEYIFRSLEFGDRSGRALGQIAFVWRARGRPDIALKWYERAKGAQRHPGDFDSFIGDCWVDLGADDKARGAYESTTTFQPDQPDGWVGLARLKLLNGESDGARQICRARLLQYPDAPTAQEFSALVEFFSRNYLEAERRYSALWQGDPLGGGKDSTYGAVDFRSAVACLKMHKGDQEEARSLIEGVIADANRKLESAPRDAQTLYRRAAAEAMVRQVSDCLRDLNAAITAGWIDFRLPALDPRFDNMSSTPEFRQVLSELAATVANYRAEVNARSNREN